VLDELSVGVQSVQNEVSIVLARRSKDYYFEESRGVLQERDAVGPQLELPFTGLIVHQSLIEVQDQCVLIAIPLAREDVGAL